MKSSYPSRLLSPIKRNLKVEKSAGGRFADHSRDKGRKSKKDLWEDNIELLNKKSKKTEKG